jgi:hypothetical protein
VDHLALALVHYAALLGHVDQFAQLYLGRERALAEALAGGDRVAHEDQQLAQRAEHAAEDPDRRGGHQADGVRVLAAQGAWADADQHVRHHEHREARDHDG